MEFSRTVTKDDWLKTTSINHRWLGPFTEHTALRLLFWRGKPSVCIPASVHRHKDINKHFWSLSSQMPSLYHFFYPPMLPPPHPLSPFLSWAACIWLQSLGRVSAPLPFLAHLLCTGGLGVLCPYWLSCLWLFGTKPVIFYAVWGAWKCTPVSSLDPRLLRRTPGCEFASQERHTPLWLRVPDKFSGFTRESALAFLRTPLIKLLFWWFFFFSSCLSFLLARIKKV